MPLERWQRCRVVGTVIVEVLAQRVMLGEALPECPLVVLGRSRALSSMNLHPTGSAPHRGHRPTCHADLIWACHAEQTKVL